MRSLRILLVVVFVSFFALGQAYSAELKTAYVDLARVFDEYVKTKDYDDMLEKKHSGYEEERNGKLDKIRDAQGKLALMKENEQKKLEEQIDKDKAALLEYDRERQADLRKERDEKIRDILLEIEKVIKDYSEKEQYMLVFNDKVLVYADESLEITDQIIKILNDKYAKQGK